jgi:poly-gamma-glutamate synthesis protein (capsule biosynthesis protein)
VAAEAGADVVIGHHSHALQGYEKLDRTLVAYSLGNLVFAGNWSPAFKEAALLEVRFATGGASREEIDFRFLPISVDRQPDLPFQPYFLEEPRAGAVREKLACYLGATEEGDCEAPVEAPGPPAEPATGERTARP